MLERRYRVLLVDSAEGAVAAVSEDIHAVVLDIKMKGHDGFWACSEMRKLCPGMPVIFYSAYQDLKDPYRLINEHYPIGYITKGGDTTMLLDAIDTAVKLSTIAMFGKRVLEEHRASREGDVERP
jgi:DNA-binding NtrC family response regulator